MNITNPNLSTQGENSTAGAYLSEPSPISSFADSQNEPNLLALKIKSGSASEDKVKSLDSVKLRLNEIDAKWRGGKFAQGRWEYPNYLYRAISIEKREDLLRVLEELEIPKEDIELFPVYIPPPPHKSFRKAASLSGKVDEIREKKRHLEGKMIEEIDAIELGNSAGEISDECCEKYISEVREKYEPEIEKLEILASEKEAVEFQILREETGNASHSWLKPLPFDDELLSVPKFDPEFLPDSLGRYAKDASERIGCSLDYIAVGLLVVFSSIIGAGCAIRPHRLDDWTVIPNLWGGIIGLPGSKKSAALSAAMIPLGILEKEAGIHYVENRKRDEVEKIENELRKKAHKTSLEAAIKSGSEKEVDLIKSKLTLLENEVPTSSHKRYKTNNTTVEKLQELLAENSRGLLQFNDELMGFLASLDKVGREDARAFYLEGWNGWASSEYQTDRIIRGSVSCNPCLSILGGIQPSKLRLYLREVLANIGNDGFIQRFQLLVYPDPIKRLGVVDRLQDNEARQRIIEIARRLAATDFFEFGAKIEGEFPLPVFRFRTDAQDFFHKRLGELENRLMNELGEELIAQHLSKYPKLMPSLALINYLLRAANGEPPNGISIEDVTKAERLCSFLESHARRVYSMIDRRGIFAAKVLLNKIRDGELKDGFTKRDAQRPVWSGITTSEDAQEACEELVERGYLKEERIEPSSKGGRPTIKYCIHPDLRKMQEKRTVKTDKTG
jgi:hypothetical protein